MLRVSRGVLCGVYTPLSRQFTRQFTVLGIETSADDTCVAVIDVTADEPPIIRHNIIRRSLDLSEPHGGIVPNIVGAFHAMNLGKILSQVREQGGLNGLDLIAVSTGVFVNYESDHLRTRFSEVSCSWFESWYYLFNQV
jgi:hypothetical protein